ncbi:MAG: hypothetical protein JNL98_11640 [Bryobacterales bacterium]|nr:hypothetical protein [Bryobacterales bacterium]
MNGDGNLLICETRLDTGTRISEVTGPMIKHVDLEKGMISIAQHNWRMDIDDPKTEKGRRVLALLETFHHDEVAGAQFLSRKQKPRAVG